MTLLPAHAALWERMLKKPLQLASLILLARWWFLSKLAVCKSS
jgi:hypothetical protein